MPAPFTKTIRGVEVPTVGLGVFEVEPRETADAVADAIAAGYRHVDTASAYGNEREVGEGLRASGVPRNDVFVVTKVWPSHFAPRELLRAAKESLVKLRLSEVDLLLLHWPNPQVPLAETLGALCMVKEAGQARHIGVSNFNTALLDEAVKLATEPLVCNQFEMHPFLDQSKLVAACRAHGMAVTAYSPIARGNAKNDALLTRIGKTHGKTAAQVSLRYLVQQQVVVIPRTSKLERLEENFSIFDFMLSGGEMAEIAQLAQPSGRIVDWSFSGPTKWD